MFTYFCENLLWPFSQTSYVIYVITKTLPIVRGANSYFLPKMALKITTGLAQAVRMLFQRIQRMILKEVHLSIHYNLELILQAKEKNHSSY